ncbi:MAG: hypothetical protein HY904_24100 [Deltaproteobacteria bacterium]|nr:hypothetical protein [Deltaproteobacteria bacterium]
MVPSIVLYEDQLGQQVTEFGPHVLLIQCVADLLEQSPHELKKRLVPRPMKGKEKVARCLLEDLQNLACDFAWILVLIDGDRLREIAQLDNPRNEGDIRRAILKRHPVDGQKVVPVVLENNMESLLEACRRCWPGLPVGRKAKPSPIERDGVLNKIAWAPDMGVRQCVLNGCPALEQLRNFSACAVSG